MATVLRDYSREHEILAAGVSWLEADTAWPWRLAGAVLIVIVPHASPVMEHAHRVFGAWATVWTWLLTAGGWAVAFWLVRLTVQRWVDGGRERELVFHRDGPTCTAFGLSTFPNDAWRRYYAINADHATLKIVRARPSMTLRWGGESTGMFDVVVDYQDGRNLDIATDLPAAEAEEIAAIAMEALAEVRAAATRPLLSGARAPSSSMVAPEWSWFFERFPAYRPIVEHDRGKRVVARGVEWWEGSIVRGSAMALFYWVVVLSVPFIVAAMINHWKHQPVISSIGLAMAAIAFAFAWTMPEAGLRGIKRSLEFLRDGRMRLSHGLAMYKDTDWIHGHYDEIMEIMPRRMTEGWGVMLYKRNGAKTYLVVEMTEEDARELAQALKLALAEFRSECGKEPGNLPAHGLARSKVRTSFAVNRG